MVAAVERGKPIRSLRKRLRELEKEEDELIQALEVIDLKRDKTEERLLSAEVMAENYHTVPEIIDGLVAAENWNRLKSLLSQYVEVIEWNQDAKDRKAGTVKIMLFEHAYSAKAEASKEISAPLVNNGALSSNNRLHR
jgi:hypothetical protein